MQPITLITDSSACLPASLVQELGICVLPLTVHLPGADRPDGEAGLPGRVYEALEADQPVKSSPPSVAEYLAAIEGAQGAGAVVVTPAAEYTAMPGEAALACDLAGRPAQVIDSRTGAAGQGLVVVAGARVAAAGGSFQDVISAIEDASARVDQVGALAVLTPLRRSGRVPARLLARPTRAAPHSVFRMRSGGIEPLAATRSAAAAVDRVAGEWEKGGGPGAALSVVFHGDAPEAAEALTTALSGAPIVAGFSAAMGIYTGRGVVGVAWLPAA